MLRSYLKIAYKVLLRRKFFTFVSLFGICFTLTLLIICAAVLENTLSPGEHGSRLKRAMFLERITLIGDDTHLESLLSYHFLERHVRALKTPEAVAIHSSARSTAVYVGGRKVELAMKYTDAAFWEVVEFEFVEGTPYRREDVENAEAVAVISDRTRDNVFGRESAVGEFIETTNGTFRVVGVVPQAEMLGEFAYADIWVPATHSRSAMTRTEPYGSFNAIVVPHEGGDREAIRRELEEHLDVVREDLAGQFDSVACFLGSKLDLLAQEITGPVPGGNVAAIAIIIGLMVLFMLLPAMNLVTMNVSRIYERSSEIGVRKAFGASSPALVLQFIGENVVLTLIGGVLALVLSVIALDIVNSSGVVPYAHLAMNWSILLYSLLICLFFGVFSGVLPAYRMSRLQPVEALRGVAS
jgi:putative ABC transport system permease protein